MSIIMKTGGGSGKPNVLTVAIDSGATVTASNGNKTLVKTSVDGYVVFKLPEVGTWNIVAEMDGQTAEDAITITDEYPVEVPFSFPLRDLAEGTLIRIIENGSDVNFILAQHDYESGLNGAGRELLVRNAIHSNRVWHSSRSNVYASSSIVSWLTGTYKNYFSTAVQNAMGSTTIYYTPMGSGGSSVKTSAWPIFLLSTNEVYGTGGSDTYYPREGTKLVTADKLKTSDSKTYYWLRSPYKAGSTQVWTFSTSCQGFYTDASYGVRPAFTLPSTLRVDAIPNADGSYTLKV